MCQLYLRYVTGFSERTKKLETLSQKRELSGHQYHGKDSSAQQ